MEVRLIWSKTMDGLQVLRSGSQLCTGLSAIADVPPGFIQFVILRRDMQYGVILKTLMNWER